MIDLKFIATIVAEDIVIKVQPATVVFDGDMEAIASIPLSNLVNIKLSSKVKHAVFQELISKSRFDIIAMFASKQEPHTASNVDLNQSSNGDI